MFSKYLERSTLFLEEIMNENKNKGNSDNGKKNVEEKKNPNILEELEREEE